MARWPIANATPSSGGRRWKVTCLKHGTTVMTDCLMFTAALVRPRIAPLKKLIGKPITLTLMRPMRGYCLG